MSSDIPNGVGPHEFRELELMLAGIKPLAMFFDVIPPTIELPEAEFEPSLKSGQIILRDGAAGLFLASSAFPRSRETRGPMVKEILPHCHELDPKFRYLCDAPVADDKDNPTIIRFSRKIKSSM